MRQLYAALKIGLLSSLFTITACATVPQYSRQEKAKTFGELVSEKAKKGEYESMEDVTNRQLSSLMQETKKINSGLEQCIEEGGKEKAESCYESYTLAADRLRRHKWAVGRLLKALAIKKYMEKDYKGGESTLKQELLLISHEIENDEFGLKYCSAYSQEAKQEECRQAGNESVKRFKEGKSKTLYILGIISELDGKCDAARLYYLQALEIEPENPDYIKRIEGLYCGCGDAKAKLHLSALLQETKKFGSELEQCIKNSNETNPEECHEEYVSSVDFFKNKKEMIISSLKKSGWVSFLMKDYQCAKDLLNRQLSLFSQELEMYESASRLYDYCGEETIQAYDNQIDDLRKRKADVLNSLGQINKMQYKMRDALKFYREAQDLDPNNPYYQQKVEELKGVYRRRIWR